MSDAFDTTSFFIVESENQKGLEIWCDWVPAVDDAPLVPVVGQRLGRDLLISGSSQAGQVRKFSDLAPDVWEDLSRLPLWLVLCGPSGVVGRKQVPWS